MKLISFQDKFHTGHFPLSPHLNVDLQYIFLPDEGWSCSLQLWTLGDGGRSHLTLWFDVIYQYWILTCNISSFHRFNIHIFTKCVLNHPCMSCKREQSLGQVNSTYICLPDMYLVIIRLACVSCKREQSLCQGDSTYIFLQNVYLIIIRFNMFLPSFLSLREWVSDWASEWVSQSVSECMSERASERATAGGIEPGTSWAWVPQIRAERPHHPFVVSIESLGTFCWQACTTVTTVHNQTYNRLAGVYNQYNRMYF